MTDLSAMKPYFEDGSATIYHGDCREIMREAVADVLVTDPPYGTAAYATDRKVLTPYLLKKWLGQYVSVAVMGWPERLVQLLVEAREAPDEWLVWWPTNAELRGRFMPVPVARETEHIALFGALRESRGAPIGRTLEYKGPHQRAKHNVSPKGKRWGDVWRDPSPGLAMVGGRLHPNEKPASLMVRLLNLVADGTVVDPFMGSGTTLVAAKSLGRCAIGIEIEERYCEIAAKRLLQQTLGLSA